MVGCKLGLFYSILSLHHNPIIVIDSYRGLMMLSTYLFVGPYRGRIPLPLSYLLNGYGARGEARILEVVLSETIGLKHLD